MVFVRSIHFNHTVDLAYEPEARSKPDRSSQQEEQEHHDRRVAKVQES